MFINKNKLSLLVAKNRYPGGEKTINLSIIIEDDIAIDVAELTLNHSKETGKSYNGNFILVKLSHRLNQLKKTKIIKEVDEINKYLTGLQIH
jgi:hypothetical protein